MGNIKSLFPDIQCISVQNGIRWDLSRPLQPHLSFDHYFCFGEVEGDILRQAALPVAHRYPIGSLKAGIFWAQHPPQKNKEFDLCLISHFEVPQDIHTDQWAEEMSIAYNETGKSVFRQVANFSAKKNLTLCVAMRFSLGSAGYKEEKNYYTHSNNGQVHFIPQSPYSSYKATQASRLSVTCSSTLGYEALGMGERVIFAKDIEEIASIVLKGPWKTNLVTHRLPDLQRLYSASGEEFYAKAQLSTRFKRLGTSKWIKRSH
jgi:surface carbohydrate biosynthesis protein